MGRPRSKDTTERIASAVAMHKDGFGYAAIAETLGVSRCAVSHLIAKARDRGLIPFTGHGEKMKRTLIEKGWAEAVTEPADISDYFRRFDAVAQRELSRHNVRYPSLVMKETGRVPRYIPHPRAVFSGCGSSAAMAVDSAGFINRHTGSGR